jgi:tetratricopeptide (TPR) repeat protein
MPGGPKELDEAFEHLRKNPSRSLEICQRYVSAHPSDANGYYSRFNAWDALGERDKALADINRVLELDPNMGGYASRGKFFRRTGQYRRGLEDLSRARELDEDTWKTSLYPLERADCYARLGHLDEAVADCSYIPDDWWMPSIDGLPGGNKQEIINEIKRRALEARGATRS